MREGLATIKQSAQQASQLLHQLAAVHQATPGNREYVDLNQFAGVAAELLRRVISSRIGITVISDKAPVAVNLERVRLQRLVLAWVMQATERMPRRGEVRLQTGRISRDGKSFGSLVISDNGTPLVVPARAERLRPLIVGEEPAVSAFEQLRRLADSHAGGVQLNSGRDGTRLEILLPEVSAGNPSARSTKPWVLLIGKVPEDVAALAGELEVRGLAPVIAGEPVDEQLNPKLFNWDAVVIHGTVAGVPALLEPVRKKRLPVRIIVCVAAGGEISELEPWVASAAELVTPEHWPRERVAEKIAKLLM